MKVLSAVCIGLMSTVCTGSFAETSGTKAAEHHHEHKAPHGGTLIVLGEELAHLELVVSSEKDSISGYILDGEAENPIRIAQPQVELSAAAEGSSGTTMTLTLNAVEDPLTGEKIGSTSEFTGPIGGLKGVKRFSGALKQLSVKGQDFSNVTFRFPEGNE